jgi:type IV secretion system protein VirB10
VSEQHPERPDGEPGEHSERPDYESVHRDGIGEPAEGPGEERLPIEGLVRGERSIPYVSRSRSLQSRASSVLAGGLTMVLGVGALTWYYANALTRPGRAREAAQAATVRRAQGEMPLPSLGRIDPPAVGGAVLQAAAMTAAAAGETGAAVGAAGGSATGADGAGGGSAAAGAIAVSKEPFRATAVSSVGAAPPPGTMVQGGAPRAPHTRAATNGVAGQVGPDRRLAGPVFVRQSASDAPLTARLATDSPVSVSDNVPSSERDEHGLAQLLRPTPVAAVQAKVLPTRRFLLPKGSFIDCTLETAIDSTLPGMTTCVAATDTFSADGSVVLLERGTRLVGETRGEVEQGTVRVFVLWTEARTPTGVVVPLDSPGTDELGRAGLAGTVDRHFWERFGAAILITAIDGAVQAATQPSGGSGGTVIYNPSASQGVLTEVLKSTLNIPPTVRKSQGDRIQVFVARDVDFRSVYELRP